jgi:Rod binding domain-containing protein
VSAPIAPASPHLPSPPNAKSLARVQQEHANEDPQIRKAAEGLEALFLDYMMQAMRKTVPKNEMDLESPATEIYRGMLDSETSQTAARMGGVGLADQIVAYLSSQRYTLPRGKVAPMPAQGMAPAQGPPGYKALTGVSSTETGHARSRATGGTNEGQ